MVYGNLFLCVCFCQIQIEKGKRLHVKMLAMGDMDEKTGEREVFFELNGQLRSLLIKDTIATKVRCHISTDPTPLGPIS